jgi:WhiB family redox-sensing transcriptional regulator
MPSDWTGFDLFDQRLDWQEQGLCGQADPEAWFPEKGHSPRDAQKVCARCPVRQECLDYALANPEATKYGIWAGLTEHDRRQARKGVVVPIRQAATHKVCTGCGVNKPRGEFHRDRDKITPRCRDCHRVRDNAAKKRA